ncbi:hypothetical protein OWM54_09395 [Myxococcus sp. MISCRS1]|uniref:hypothetical protein n=1 Tax=Myxococcus sp. MISCRS1 TaxID=2996786 RepID=UPI00227150E7|nr:hypothetical protein [Myxococcus sp. MISCRS1]MCY0997347.1 hypothetical protein [Myxococcus sp. MISCRS1]
MGSVNGGAIIDFDFHALVDEALEPESPQSIDGTETPEARKLKALKDAGMVALRALGISARIPLDAPISYDDATVSSFMDYAVGVVDGKTLVLNWMLGADQQFTVKGFKECSRQHGPVLVFYYDDRTSTYAYSLFRDGKRVRLRVGGPSVPTSEEEDEGELLPGEPMVVGEEDEVDIGTVEDRVVEAFLGRPLNQCDGLLLAHFEDAEA